MLRIEDLAPDFTAPSTIGSINLYQYLGESWGLIFSHPADFTPVCSSEIATAAALEDEFSRRNIKLVGLSTDTIMSHGVWVDDLEAALGVEIGFPIVADEDRRIADLYGMIHPNEDRESTVRTTFIVAPDRRIRAMINYPIVCGRNFDEILRVFDSLQRSSTRPVATPANWNCGAPVLLMPTVTDQEAERDYTELNAPLPYLRHVKDDA